MDNSRHRHPLHIHNLPRIKEFPWGRRCHYLLCAERPLACRNYSPDYSNAEKSLFSSRSFASLLKLSCLKREMWDTQSPVCQIWMAAVVCAELGWAAYSVSQQIRDLSVRVTCCLKIDEPVSRIHHSILLPQYFASATVCWHVHAYAPNLATRCADCATASTCLDQNQREAHRQERESSRNEINLKS